MNDQYDFIYSIYKEERYICKKVEEVNISYVFQNANFAAD